MLHGTVRPSASVPTASAGTAGRFFYSEIFEKFIGCTLPEKEGSNESLQGNAASNTASDQQRETRFGARGKGSCSIVRFLWGVASPVSFLSLVLLSDEAWVLTGALPAPYHVHVLYAKSSSVRRASVACRVRHRWLYNFSHSTLRSVNHLNSARITVAWRTCFLAERWQNQVYWAIVAAAVLLQAALKGLRRLGINKLLSVVDFDSDVLSFRCSGHYGDQRTLIPIAYLLSVRKGLFRHEKFALLWF